MINDILHYDPVITRRNLKIYNLLNGVTYTLEDLHIFTYIIKDKDNKGLYFYKEYVFYYGNLVKEDYKPIINKIIIDKYISYIRDSVRMIQDSKYYLHNNNIICVHPKYMAWAYVELKDYTFNLSYRFSSIYGRTELIIFHYHFMKYFKAEHKFFTNYYIAFGVTFDKENDHTHIYKKDIIELFENYDRTNNTLGA